MSFQTTVANFTSSWRRRLVAGRRRLPRDPSEVREGGRPRAGSPPPEPSLVELESAFRRCIEEKLAGPEYAVFLENDLNHLRRYALTLSWVPEGEGLLLDPACGAGYFVEILRRQRPYTVVTPDYFDLEKDPAPYPDETFDGILLMEVLEHFRSDPMFALAELNRVLKPGGFLLLTTPNIASWAALHRMIGYETPYHYGIYTRGGLTNRHNREYTVREVGRLVTAAGFGVERLAGIDAYPTHDALPPLPGIAAGDRGDTAFCLGRKQGPVRDRFPDWLYAPW